MPAAHVPGAPSGLRINPERAADPAATRYAEPRAYAQALRGLHTWMLDWDFEPGADDAGRMVLEKALAGTDGTVQVWVREPTPAHDEIALGFGLEPGRDLFQLRVPLPLAAAGERDGPPLVWQPFRPGVDEDAWLEVNNRAFDWHREQGGWSRTEIEAEEREPWFDPAGFVMHWSGDRLAGFCWTKVHPADPATGDPALGEIYVIAADPDFGGRGLGRALTVAALEWMHRTHDIDVGMLYVDADNEAAVRLYRRLGFHRHHTDRAYLREALSRG